MSTAQSNTQFAKAAIQSLIEQGARQFCISPGSRSTPLTLAVAENADADAIIHYDERGTAFFALGSSKASSSATVLICTSGSAVANYLPAIIEARQSHTPLLLLTADRPPELRNTGANQSINQIEIFGDYVEQFVDLPCPDADTMDSSIQTISKAWNLANDSQGPVHINCQFREPFHDETAASYEPVAYKHSSPDKAMGDSDADCVIAEFQKAKNPLLIVGHLKLHEQTWVSEFIKKTKLLCMSDIQSGIPSDLDAFDFASIDTEFKLDHDLILHLGGRLCSKYLEQHLSKLDCPYILINAHADRLNPLQREIIQIEAELDSLLKLELDTASNATPYKAINSSTNEKLAEALETAEFNEYHVAVAISQSLGEQDLFIGNSTPIRTFNSIALPETTVASNRGASGIDGLIATACGFAYQRKNALTAVIGDLSSLHDLNSLALISRLDTAFILVIINNDGGGIFNFLPIRENENFERYFLSPHGMDFSSAAGMFKLAYQKCMNQSEFENAYKQALSSESKMIIEVTMPSESTCKFVETMRCTNG